VGFLLGFTVAAVAVPLQLVGGDWAARHVATHQPVKLAAMEGVTHTESGVALHLGGFYVDGHVVGGLPIPDGLSFLAFHDPSAKVTGLDSVPARDRPPVNVVRTAFQLMVGIGTVMLGLAVWFAIAWRRRRDLPSSRWFLRAALLAGPAAVLALEAGWVTTEVGRQPWIVYRIMRVRDAVTDAAGIRYGYFGLLVVYAALTVATVLVLRRLAGRPLAAADDEGPS
jgi:cytochrome d ubiquinol oxidase subunit I